MAAIIKPIDESSVRQIQSGQVIADLCAVVKELVENSIDAGCSNVRFKNQGLDLIEVQDNGSGISPSNHAYVALKHHTSKLSSFSDLASLQSFGFRGEALASLCALSHLVVTTCVEADVPRGSRLSFDTSGVLTETAVVASHRGTTVSVNGLFQNLPVRRRELERNIKREWHKVCALLHQYACIQTNVKFSVSQQPSRGNRTVLFSTRGNATTRENIVNIFGAKIMSALIPVDLDLNLPSSMTNLDFRDAGSHEGRLVGYVSRPSSGDGRHTPDRQMFFVNGRPCSLPRFVKTFNEVYRSYNSSQSPFIFVDFQLDTHRYDVNVSPDKLNIFLHDQSLLLKFLRTSIDDLFSSYQGIIPLSQATHGSQWTKGEGKITAVLKKSSGAMSDQTPGSTNDDLSSDDEILLPRLLDSDITVEGKAREAGESDEGQTATDSRSNENSSSPRPDNFRTAAWTPASSGSGMNEGQARKRSKLNSTQFVDVGLSGSMATASAPFRAKSHKNKLSLSQLGKGSQERQTQTGILIADINCVAEDDTQSHTVGGSTTESYSSAVESLYPKSRQTEHIVSGAQLDRLEAATMTQAREVKRLAKIKTPSFAERNEPSDLVNCTDAGGNSSEVSSDSTNVQDVSTSVVTTKDDKRSVCTKDPLCIHIFDVSFQVELDNAIATSIDHAHDKNQIETRGYVTTVQNNLAQSETSRQGAESKRLEHSLRRYSSLPGAGQRIQTNEAYLQSRMNLYLSDCWVKNDNSTLDAAEEDIAPDAEYQLTVTIGRNHFSRMRVVGQFNKGFIIAVRPAALRNIEDSRARHDELFIIDQHASDEKYNFERLQSSTIVQSQALVVPKSLRLTALEEEIVSENIAAIEANGFKVGCDASKAGSVGSRWQLLALPLSRETTFSLGDLEELITLLGDEPSQSGYIPRPSKVRKMFAMRACRGSVMIGQALTPNQMVGLVKQMGELDKPWNCPHGRPTMRHLCRLSAWEGRSWRTDTTAPVLSSWTSFVKG
ncbi:hypothetical protein CP533_5563 [Ophiocordyceps camponoti-saundersi (nom. inval.)]|nr:hypothetical protein CP533_5563 [Ophiocordyceps camponoti-saundersi (nom. inval.)]